MKRIIRFFKRFKTEHKKHGRYMDIYAVMQLAWIKSELTEIKPRKIPLISEEDFQKLESL